MITEPAIGYGGGLFGLFLHGKGSREGDRFIPPALTGFGGGGTQNGTRFIGAEHRHTRNHDSIRYLVGAGYANVNLDIYSGDIAGFNKKMWRCKPIPKALAVCKSCCSAWGTHRFFSRRLAILCAHRCNRGQSADQQGVATGAGGKQHLFGLGRGGGI